MTQTTFTDNVMIDGSQDIEQLRVQGHTTQDDPLQTWENSAEDVLAQITGDGRFQLGDDLGMATPDALVEAHRAETATEKPARGFHSLGRITGALSEVVAWVVGELELLGTGGISALHSALRVRLTNQNTGTMDSGAELRAGDFEAVNDGGSEGDPVPRLVGLHVAVTNEENGFLDEAIGLKVAMNNAGEQTTAYVIHAEGGIAYLGDTVEVKVPDAVPDKPATDVIRIYGKDDGKLYAKNWIGDEGEEFDLTGGSDSALIPGICNGRLTLSSGVPIPVTDVLAAATLYFTPFRGNQVALYDGSEWALYPFTERSLSLSGLAANTPYDVFLYDNAGTLTLEAVAWNAPDNGAITSISNASPPVVTVASHTLVADDIVTISGNSVSANNGTWRVGTTTATTFQLKNFSGTNPAAPGSVGTGGTWQKANQVGTRATALTTQDGVLVKSGAATRRYLGTFRTTGVSGQTEDSISNRLLWNYYHRQQRKFRRQETTASWTQGSPVNTWRAANNNLANSVSFVIGWSEDAVVASVLTLQAGIGTSGTVGVGKDSVSADSSDVHIYGQLSSSQSINEVSPIYAQYNDLPGEGYHILYWIERTGNTAPTYYGQSTTGVTYQGGLTGGLLG